MYYIKIMLSSGEVYHLAFKVHDELMQEGVRSSIVQIRYELRKLNEKDMPVEEMVARVKEAVKENRSAVS
jgi:hypothetical protein